MRSLYAGSLGHDGSMTDNDGVLARAEATLRGYLEETGLTWEPGARHGEFVVTLPGDKKLRTVTSVLLGEHGTSVAAFVIRKPDENHAAFYRFLLRRNLKLPGLAYGLDRLGDVYVRGTVPTEAVTSAYLDQLFGVVLEAADAPFNDLLLLGFRTSMKKEWDWRVARGESLANLEAFRGQLADDPEPLTAADGGAGDAQAPQD